MGLKQFGAGNSLSEAAQHALKDLESLGYDIEALSRRNMDDSQIMDFREKAYRFRGIESPALVRDKDIKEIARFFGLGVDLSLTSSPEQASTLARHILYLAEKELSDT